MKLHISEIKLENKPVMRWQFMKKYFEMGMPATYSKDEKLQCKKGKRRSFNDLHDLIKYYYPITSKVGLMRAIQRAGFHIDIRGFFCNSEKTIVFFRNSNNTEFNKEIFSSIKFNSDIEHRKRIDKYGLSMDILTKYMK